MHNSDYMISSAGPINNTLPPRHSRILLRALLTNKPLHIYVCVSHTFLQILTFGMLVKDKAQLGKDPLFPISLLTTLSLLETTLQDSRDSVVCTVTRLQAGQWRNLVG